ncbi:hypothetical protein MRX96_041660 [Rhipicephalus microplus]
MNSQDGSRQHRQWHPRSSHGQNESPVNQTMVMWSWPAFERRESLREIVEMLKSESHSQAESISKVIRGWCKKKKIALS